MTKKLTPWEKQYRQIRKDITAGKIICDNNFLLADFDGLIMLVRGDLIPVGYKSSWMELQMVSYDFGVSTVPYEKIMARATKKELKILEGIEATL